MENNKIIQNICSECGNTINIGANRCGHCGSLTSKSKRFIIHSATLISALLVVIPLWQLVISTTDIFKNTINYETQISGCDPSELVIAFANLESNRFIKVKSAKIVKINSNPVNEQLVEKFGGNIFIPPLQQRTVQYLRLKAVKGLPIKECKNGCNYEVRINVSEGDNSKQTAKVRSCEWLLNKPFEELLEE